MGGTFGPNTVFGEGQPNEEVIADNVHALVCLDSEGHLRWVRTKEELGVINERYFGYDLVPVRQIAVANDSNHFAIWAPTNSITIGDTIFADPGCCGIALVKYDEDGTIVWARHLRGSEESAPTLSLATDRRGHVYVGGAFRGASLEIEGVVLANYTPNDYKADGFAAHYDSDGNLVRAIHLSDRENEWIRSVAASLSGDFYVVGSLSGPNITVTIGNYNSPPTTGQVTMFLAKFGATSTARIPQAGIVERLELGAN